MCLLASTRIGDWTIAIPCCIARDCLIFHLNLQRFELFSIVCGLTTDFALIHDLISRLFFVATDELAHEQADILLATVMKITCKMLWSFQSQILILQTTQSHGTINGCEAVNG
jgi:hypothetical protein